VLAVVEARAERALVPVLLPAPRAVVSWTTRAEAATLELVVHTSTGTMSRPLPYVAFEPGARASLDGFDSVARIATDVVTAVGDIVAIDVRASARLEAVAVSVPVHVPPAARARFAGEIGVPERRQFVAGEPASNGWCAPAAIAMLLGAHGVERSVSEVAAAVFDRAYRGTGNWAFDVAYAAACECFGAVAYLRDLQTVDALLDAGFPLAVSLAWEDGALPGAPLPASGGHLVVVRGRTPSGEVIVNDPAQPRVRHVYDATAFECAWLGHGGVALLVTARERVDDLVAAANA
jgi:hypothetical protein